MRWKIAEDTSASILTKIWTSKSIRKRPLEFFGVDSEDETNQKRLRDLENGQCLMSDIYGRVGVIQFHPIFEELLHAFDTRPPIRKEVD